jgi:hypothetical protein
LAHISEWRHLTTHSTGLATSLILRFDVSCSPVNSGVRRFYLKNSVGVLECVN